MTQATQAQPSSELLQLSFHDAVACISINRAAKRNALSDVLIKALQECVDGLPETVKDGKTGALVAPGDPKALAAALIPLVRDAAARETMGRAARKDYEARYRTERFAQDTLSIYQDALHDIPRR